MVQSWLSELPGGGPPAEPEAREAYWAGLGPAEMGVVPKDAVERKEWRLARQRAAGRAQAEQGRANLTRVNEDKGITKVEPPVPLAGFVDGGSEGEPEDFAGWLGQVWASRGKRLVQEYLERNPDKFVEKLLLPFAQKEAERNKEGEVELCPRCQALHLKMEDYVRRLDEWWEQHEAAQALAGGAV